MARRILRAFAENGDRTEVDNDTQSSGIVNYQQGYPPRYQLNPETDPTALRINRGRHNQLWHDLSSNIKEWQEQLAPNFITAAANGGTAFSYPLGMVVWDGAGYRRSTSANNTADVTDNANWEDYNFSSFDPSTLGTASAEDVGVAVGNVPQLADIGSGVAGLPAVDGSQLTGLDFLDVRVNFNGIGTPAVRDSLNVSSIFDNAVGDQTVNFQNALSTSDYTFTTSGSSGNATQSAAVWAVNGTLLTTSIRLRTAIISVTGSNTRSDIQNVCLMIAGGN